MTKQDEKRTALGSISIKDIVNLSIVDMVMLQLLLKHEKPVVRHILYNEISQFLSREKQKVAKSTKFNKDAAGTTEFQKFIDKNKQFSSSSLYYSLDNLESNGLVKFNYDDMNRKESVEATPYTEILINTILKHIIKFGLIEAEQSRYLPGIIKEVVEEKEKKHFETMLYVWFSNYINIKCINTFSTITDNLFVLSKEEAFENVAKLGLKNVQNSSLFNNTIRESDNFFDGIIIPYHFRSANLVGVAKSDILKEAFRIVKNDGVIIIHGYTKIPDIDHAFFNIFTKWVNDIYKDIVFYSEEEFQTELIAAGAKDTKVYVYKGHLFGVGSK
ncbi:MAG: hypothetical protein KGD61_00225 [Candidatus Lokiarchaeota archaeon]|nr:hypothetical protein [Candidatus Lokiarchaeota archaeon]